MRSQHSPYAEWCTLRGSKKPVYTGSQMRASVNRMMHMSQDWALDYLVKASL